MKFIACIDKNGGLGYRGKLLFSLKKDMQRFKTLTTGGVVVMGYNTYKSLPRGALPNRLNIVMTSRHTMQDIKDKSVVVVSGRQALHNYLKMYGIDPKDVWVIGGAKIYETLWDDCDDICLTCVDAVRQSDCKFPLEKLSDGWDLTSYIKKEEDGLKFAYERFVRK